MIDSVLDLQDAIEDPAVTNFPVPKPPHGPLTCRLGLQAGICTSYVA